MDLDQFTNIMLQDKLKEMGTEKRRLSRQKNISESLATIQQLRSQPTGAPYTQAGFNEKYAGAVGNLLSEGVHPGAEKMYAPEFRDMTAFNKLFDVPKEVSDLYDSGLVSADKYMEIAPQYVAQKSSLSDEDINAMIDAGMIPLAQNVPKGMTPRQATIAQVRAQATWVKTFGKVAYAQTQAGGKDTRTAPERNVADILAIMKNSEGKYKTMEEYTAPDLIALSEYGVSGKELANAYRSEDPGKALEVNKAVANSYLDQAMRQLNIQNMGKTPPLSEVKKIGDTYNAILSGEEQSPRVQSVVDAVRANNRGYSKKQIREYLEGEMKDGGQLEGYTEAEVDAIMEKL